MEISTRERERKSKLRYGKSQRVHETEHQLIHFMMEDDGQWSALPDWR